MYNECLREIEIIDINNFTYLSVIMLRLVWFRADTFVRNVTVRDIGKFSYARFVVLM